MVVLSSTGALFMPSQNLFPLFFLFFFLGLRWLKGIWRDWFHVDSGGRGENYLFIYLDDI